MEAADWLVDHERCYRRLHRRPRRDRDQRRVSAGPGRAGTLLPDLTARNCYDRRYCQAVIGVSGYRQADSYGPRLSNSLTSEVRQRAYFLGGHLAVLPSLCVHFIINLTVVVSVFYHNLIFTMSSFFLTISIRFHTVVGHWNLALYMLMCYKLPTYTQGCRSPHIWKILKSQTLKVVSEKSGKCALAYI